MVSKLPAYQGWQGWFFSAWAIALVVFQIVTSGFGLLPDMQQRAVHTMFAFVLALAITSKKGFSGKRGVLLPVFMVLVVLAALNAYFSYVRFTFSPLDSNTLDIVLGIAIVLLALEISRKTIGLVFPIMVAVIILYAIFGYLIPGGFGHAGLRPLYVVQMLYQSPQGIWGSITGVMATVISMFLIFGSLLYVTGGGRAFIDLATVAAGRVRGGPALVAVVASGLFGMLSGSPVANSTLIGNFTIPLMKRTGYRPAFAAAVESAASVGGLIMPPVMGVAAFIMADFLGVSYAKVMIAAVIPAFLYYFCIGFATRFTALAENLQAVPADQMPAAREGLRWSRLSHVILPLIVLIVFLIMGYSATRVAFYAWAMSVALFLITSGLRPAVIKERLASLLDSFIDAAKSIAGLTALVICSNMVVALLNATGLAVKINILISDVVASSVVLTLIIAAVAINLLGMVLPPVAAYVMAVAMISLALTQAGLLPMAVHMFLFYFSVLGGITPPVCLVCYVTAAIAQTNWLKVAWTSVRLASVAFFIPFFFVIRPAYLLQGSISQVIFCAVSGILGTACLASAVSGYLTARLNLVSRIAILASGLLFLYATVQTSLWGAILLLVTLTFIFREILTRSLRSIYSGREKGH